MPARLLGGLWRVRRLVAKDSRLAVWLFVALALGISVSACGGDSASSADREETVAQARQAKVKEYRDALTALPYEFRLDKTPEPGLLSGVAEAEGGVSAGFVLSLGPRPRDILDDYPNSYDSGSIYGGRTLHMFYVWTSYPRRSWNPDQLESFYAMHDKISGVGCRLYLGRDCQP